MVVDNIREGIGGWGLGGTMGGAGRVGWAVGEVGGGNADKRDKWGQDARNSSPVGRSSSRIREVSSHQERVPGSRARGGSSSSSSEGKKSDKDWFFGVLDGDLGCKSSCQLELFEVEMVAVYDSTMPFGKLDLLLCLVLGKEQV